MNKNLANEVDNQKKAGHKQQIVAQHQRTSYSGMIPPSFIIEGYEKNCPGATDRILAMTENDLRHKHELEEKT